MEMKLPPVLALQCLDLLQGLTLDFLEESSRFFFSLFVAQSFPQPNNLLLKVVAFDLGYTKVLVDYSCLRDYDLEPVEQ
ncbi:hypothetical protein CDL15_Pgr000288 [Punica granatum]|uniref:Uncharacterized protein n=1 Tax=Punica granatum TaxID=22663 RepID=A0A218Y2B2_PUNGR|nr:hypothetical protein CDL15_Pgr000288 [Punica granatum]PKI39217.1 hypothetical protein CRG98_040386 [Punica granatum]